MGDLKKKLCAIGFLTGSAAIAIHYINKSIAASSTLKNLLSAGKGAFYEWDHGNIYYKKEGSGDPVLLIHDFEPSGSSYEWNKITEKLAENHTVYTLDLLGCGRSDRPAITYTNYLYVQLLIDFVKDVIKEPVDIVSTGLSASFTITACTQDKDLFKKLVLINPADLSLLNQIPDKKSKFVKKLLELPLIGTFLYNMVYCRSNTELKFTEKWFYNPFHVNERDIDVYYESSHKKFSNGRYVLSSILGNYIYLNISHALKTIDNDICILGCSAESGMEETIALYSSLNTSIKHQLLPESKHLPQLECPDKFYEVLSKLL